MAHLRIPYTRAVYTGIKKKNEFFSHSGFSLKVTRQLPLNTAKKQNRKTHLRSVVFWNSAGFSLVFCQCKHSLPSRQYYSGFWSRGTWPTRDSYTSRDVLHTMQHYGRGQREFAHAHHVPKHQYEIQVFFAHVLFLPITRKVMGFPGSVNCATKNPGFLYFGFCQCKWAYRSKPHPGSNLMIKFTL